MRTRGEVSVSVDGQSGVQSPASAVEVLTASANRVGQREVTLSDAVGQVLAAPVRADRPSPAVDVSAMDGFAVRCADLGDKPIPVRGEVRIGSAPEPLVIGCAARIVTGGAVPAGADAVIKVEDVEQVADTIVISDAARGSLRPGASIRRRGENIGAAEVVLDAGRVITPAMITAMASFGAVQPRVFRRVRVAVISTGDEVVAPEAEPTEWQLRDGNGPALRALLASRPWLECALHERVGDDASRIRAAMERALGESDAVLLSGGVSMGHRDFVPMCLRECGAEVLFHKLPQRPGRPMLGAVSRNGQPIMALPGNPLSVLVTARRIALPVLESVAGIAEPCRVLCVSLGGAPVQPVDLWWHRLVRLASDGSGRTLAEPIEGRGSGDVVAAARSDGFVEIPPRGVGAGPWPFYSWLS